MEMLSRSLNNKQFRYVALGGVTTAFNLITIFLIVQWFNVNTPLFRNIANICAIEISLIFSFFIYRLGVWQQSSWNPKKILFRQLLLYHLATSSTLVLRGFVVFPFLDCLGISYLSNTLIGIILGAFLSYFINDRIVFSK